MRRQTETCPCGTFANYRLPSGSVICSGCASGEYDAEPLRPERDLRSLGQRASYVRARVNDALAARRERLNAEMPSKEGEEWAAALAAQMVGGDAS